jgi:Ca2+-binding EF-hand superfamily protein
VRPTRFHVYCVLVGGLLSSLVLIDGALAQRQRGGGGAPGGGAPGGGGPGGGGPGGFGGGQGGGPGGGGRQRGPGGPGGPGGQGAMGAMNFGGMNGMGGMGRGGGGAPDPNVFFNMMAQGGDTLSVDTLIQSAQRRDPNAADNINVFLQRNGINSGFLTREQYAQYFQERMQQGGGNGGNRRGAPFNEDNARQWFAQLDRNGDGQLQEDEMPQDLKASLAQWDTNKDGVISVDEFLGYARDRQMRQGAGRGNQGGFGEWGDEEPYEEDKRQLVYRAGNLPKELPPWFGQLDRDRDGQVSLFEWKAGGRTVDEFLKYDTNGDGFLTIDEVLRIESRNRPAGMGQDSLALAFGGGQGNWQGGQGNWQGGQGGPGGPGGGRNMGPGGGGPGGGGRNMGPGGGGPGGGGRGGSGGGGGRGGPGGGGGGRGGPGGGGPGGGGRGAPGN